MLSYTYMYIFHDLALLKARFPQTNRLFRGCLALRARPVDPVVLSDLLVQVSLECLLDQLVRAVHVIRADPVCRPLLVVPLAPLDRHHPVGLWVLVVRFHLHHRHAL